MEGAQLHDQTKRELDDNTMTKNNKLKGFETLQNFLHRMKFIPSIQTNDKHPKPELAMISEIYKELKDDEGNINKDDLFNFLLAVLNFYEAFLIKKAKNKMKKERDEKPQNKEQLIITIRSDLVSDLSNKIINQKTYGGLDLNNQYIITLEKAADIHKNFNLLSFNWNMTYSQSKKKEVKPPPVEGTFKPAIDKNSEKLCEQFRSKLVRY